MPVFKNLVRSFLKFFNLAVTKYSTLDRLSRNAGAVNDLELLKGVPREQAPLLLEYLGQSKSQLRQDLFVLSELDFKKKGHFVEFGATDGIYFSNAWLLEKSFGWTGILAEPAICWQSDLRKNRSAILEECCVWKDSNSTLTFNEVDDAAFSTIDAFNNSDHNHPLRKKGHTYQVRTISLNDLLEKHNAPSVIDYLSIDTEGSEYDILSNFDFSRYRFLVITCEHNFTPMREKIHVLLTAHGYVRKFENLSQFDDWYVFSASDTSPYGPSNF